MSSARRDPAAWGVVTEYVDAAGERRRLSRATIDRLLDALGAEGRRPRADGPLVVEAGRAHRLPAASEVVLEDGTRLPASDRIGARMPLGYHRLEPLRGDARPLIVTPRSCPLPERQAGIAVQLYAARSAGSWGIGDLADLASIGRWARRLGAGFLLVNPLHAPVPGIPQQPSPYSPSSRRYRTPLALRIEDIPGADALPEELGRLAAEGHRLNSERRIDRDSVWRLKSAALEAIFANFTDDRAFTAYVREQGEPLTRFALHSALVERHGPSWKRWPPELRSPAQDTIARLAGGELAPRVRFHSWVQWHLDRQLAAAGRAADLLNDLAVGVDPDGADAWIDQGSLAAGARAGAPPDLFNRNGQDWGLPPFDPWRLRAEGYAALAQTVRSGLRHAAGLRVDHVMGLFRLWWVPQDGSPAEGGYVRYPAEDMLGILALEAHRARAFVVGEDLGTVDPSIRVALRRRRVLSYRLVWFEDRPPSRFPVQALAAATTHDLPTAAGLWSGSDVDAQRSIGVPVDDSTMEGVRRRVLRIPGVDGGASPAGLVEALCESLGASPSLLVTATLDDLLLVEERPNMPGTIDEWPNWRLGLPVPLEEIVADRRARRLVRALSRR